jgi:hypothetical protein
MALDSLNWMYIRPLLLQASNYEYKSSAISMYETLSIQGERLIHTDGTGFIPLSDGVRPMLFLSILRLNILT